VKSGEFTKVSKCIWKVRVGDIKDEKKRAASVVPTALLGAEYYNYLRLSSKAKLPEPSQKSFR